MLAQQFAKQFQEESEIVNEKSEVTLNENSEVMLNENSAAMLSKNSMLAMSENKAELSAVMLQVSFAQLTCSRAS